MNIQQFEYILAVNKHRHFQKAAESCHVTQATLSAMIKKLETEMGVAIFDRSKQPVIPTIEGIEILKYAKEIIRQIDLMNNYVSESEDLIQGEINLGIIPTIANSLLPIILKPIVEAYPKLSLNIIEITTDEIIHQLKSDRIDVGILATPLFEDSLEEEILYYEAMMVYGAQKSDKEYLLPEELEKENIWLLEEGHCFANQSKTLCRIKRNTNTPGNLKFEGSSFETLLNLTDQLGGFTMIPELYFRQMNAARKAKTSSFEAPYPVREVSLVFSRKFAKRKIIEELSKKIRAQLKGKLSTDRMKKGDLNILGIY